jgi:hypothetical protein
MVTGDVKYFGSIGEAYPAALDKFGRVLYTLGRDGNPLVDRGEVDIDYLLGEYGRLKIWARQTGAYLPASARGSLDDTLRAKEDLRKVVNQILMRLDIVAEQGMKSPLNLRLR